MTPILRFALRYDVDDRVGKIALAVKGRDEPLILTYPNSGGEVADFLATAATLQAGPATVDQKTRSIQSDGWVRQQAQTEGEEVPFPW